jgi:hypothetical protein
VRKEEYDLSAHAHQERQDEKITIEEIENMRKQIAYCYIVQTKEANVDRL